MKIFFTLYTIAITFIVILLATAQLSVIPELKSDNMFDWVKYYIVVDGPLVPIVGLVFIDWLVVIKLWNNKSVAGVWGLFILLANIAFFVFLVVTQLSVVVLATLLEMFGVELIFG